MCDFGLFPQWEILGQSGRVKRPSKALSAVLLGLAMAVGACTSSHTTSRSTTTTTMTPSTTTTTALPVTTPTGTTVPSGFEPGSVTFVSATTGFVIGIDSECPAGTCVALARTTDRGSSWVLLPAPAAGYVAHGQPGSSTVPVVSEVRFADELDGWIYGPSLFATHDGGASWQHVSLGGSVASLETSGGYVDAVVSPCTGDNQCTGPLKLYQAPSTGGAFTSVLSGPSVFSDGTPSLDLSLHAPVGFVNMSDFGEPTASIYATSSLAAGSGRWKAFPNPCAPPAIPGFFVVAFVAPNRTDLYTLCGGQPTLGSEEKRLVKTVNGVSAVAGTPPFGGDAEALAVTASGTLVVATASGASWLYRSTDGGASWTTAETYGDGGIGFNDLGFTTVTQGVAIHGLPGLLADFTSHLLMTTDGGATWTVMPIATTLTTGGPLPADFTLVSASFPSSHVAWVLGSAPCESTRCPILGRTTDAGSHWISVNPPPLKVSSVYGLPWTIRFADAEDGWAFSSDSDGKGELYSTHNGGLSWTPSILPGTIGSSPGIEALAATSGSVYAVVFDPANDDFAIFASPVNKDAWNPSPTRLPLGAGPVPEFRIVLDGTAGWIIDNDRAVVGGAILTNGTWAPWTPPCQALGYGDADMASAGPKDLVVFCPPGGFADPPPSAALFRSTNGGMAFQKLLSSPPASGSDLTSPKPGTFFFQANPGVITASFDNGGTWQTVANFSSTNSSGETYPSSIDFVSPMRGYALTSAGALLTTTDGGHSWAPQGFMK